jgi:hypothetical protein
VKKIRSETISHDWPPLLCTHFYREIIKHTLRSIQGGSTKPNAKDCSISYLNAHHRGSKRQTKHQQHLLDASLDERIGLDTRHAYSDTVVQLRQPAKEK